MITKSLTHEERRDLVAAEALRLKAWRAENPGRHYTPSSQFLGAISPHVQSMTAEWSAISARTDETIARRVRTTTDRPQLAHVDAILGKLHGLPAGAARAIATDLAKKKTDDGDDEPDDDIDDKLKRRLKMQLENAHGPELGAKLYEQALEEHRRAMRQKEY
jgi:hypothetical protein